MSHTNYRTCTSPFNVSNIDAFKAAMLEANIFPHDEIENSVINACYLFDATDGTFNISGQFDGNVGAFDEDTDEQEDLNLADFLLPHVDLEIKGKPVSVITVFEDIRRGFIVNTGAWISKIVKDPNNDVLIIKDIANEHTMNP